MVTIEVPEDNGSLFRADYGPSHPAPKVAPRTGGWLNPEEAEHHRQLYLEWIEAETKWHETARASFLLHNEAVKQHTDAHEKFLQVYEFLEELDAKRKATI